MSRDKDAQLLESVAARRRRMREAFLWGPERRERAAGELYRVVMVSLVVAALACAGCVGWVYLQKALAQQRAGVYGPGPVPTSRVSR